MHSFRWQLDSVCCHWTCQHCGAKIWCGMVLNQLTVKSKNRRIQTNTNMLVCANKLENSCKCRRDNFSSHTTLKKKHHHQQKKKKAKLFWLFMFCWRCFFPCEAVRPSPTCLFASIFTGFNTSVPCHIPEHIQISLWHFTHCCRAWLYNAFIPPG